MYENLVKIAFLKLGANIQRVFAFTNLIKKIFTIVFITFAITYQESFFLHETYRPLFIFFPN